MKTLGWGGGHVGMGFGVQYFVQDKLQVSLAHDLLPRLHCRCVPCVWALSGRLDLGHPDIVPPLPPASETEK